MRSERESSPRGAGGTVRRVRWVEGARVSGRGGDPVAVELEQVMGRGD